MVRKYKNLEELIHSAEKKSCAMDIYTRVNRAASTEAERRFYLLDLISMKEYFQALSEITGNKADAKIPETILDCEDRTLCNMLFQKDSDNDEVLEKICKLLIEPFAKIDEVLEKEKSVIDKNLWETTEECIFHTS